MIQTHANVAAALSADEPVVALETAVLTHGLPRRPLAEAEWEAVRRWSDADVGDFDARAPLNLTVSQAMEAVVRAEGATPATIGVLDGTLHIGLDPADLTRLAAATSAVKATTSTLGAALGGDAYAGSTVAATLAACGHASPRPIRVFATGGIGGVHRGWTIRPDISADLGELSRSPVIVVCAGVKSILDVAATAEHLETVGVPVIGFGTDAFPLFQSPGTAAIGVPLRADGPARVAEIARHHHGSLGRREAILVTQPCPAEASIPAIDLEAAIERTDRAADTAEITGPARTPWMLDRLASETSGRSIVANIALLLANARLAAQIAVADARGRGVASVPGRAP
ncbi:MAG: pseudouridine-5'-phosphate glycosidase [Phycisphaerales bacterium]